MMNRRGKIAGVAVLAAVIAFSTFFAYAEQPEVAEPQLTDSMDKVSYSLGYLYARSLKANEVEVDTDLFVAGMKIAMADGEPVLSEEEMMEVLQVFQTEMQAKMIERMERQAAENKEEGEKFLAENATKEGVKVTESGLQYKIIEQGDGPSPAASDWVRVRYHGTFIDGTVFDSTQIHGEPAEFPLSGVIPGWTEGLQHMNVGGKAELYIPADLAYGEHGNEAVQPNQVLIFEVELLEITTDQHEQPRQPQQPQNFDWGID